MPKIAKHLQISDIIEKNMNLIFCGSAMGKVSYKAGAYYAHPANSFWKMLYQNGFTDRQLAPNEYSKLTEYGLGITDLSKTEFGKDDELSGNAYNTKRLSRIILTYTPKFLVFTGLKPGKEFIHTEFNLPKSQIKEGLQDKRIGDTQIFICTSTSPRYPNKARTQRLWKELSNLITVQQP